jgi:hypothetical protein
MEHLCKSKYSEHLVLLHENLPDKFVDLAKYLVNIYPRKNQISIYNIARQTSFYSSEIREYISRFINQGIVLRGNSNQKILLNRELAEYWKNILVPAYNAKQNELKQYINILQTLTIQSLFGDPVFYKYLPQKYGTLPKSVIIRKLIYNIFYSDSIYEEYCSAKLKIMDKSVKKLFNELDTEYSYAEFKKNHKEVWSDICILNQHLLIKITYKKIKDSIYLFISKFNGFSEPFELNLLKGPPPLSIPESVELSIEKTENLLQQKRTALLPETNFLVRQIDIVKQQEKYALDIFDFIIFWQRAIGNNCLSLKKANSLDSCLYRGKKQSVYPLVISNGNIEKLLNLSVKYNFLQYYKHEKMFQLTEFGIAAAKGEINSLPGVKRIWARNKERLAIYLEHEWQNAGRRLLGRIAKEIEAGVFVMEKQDLISRKVSEKEILSIITGFFEIKQVNIERIRSWLPASGLLQFCTAAIIPKDCSIVRNLLEGKKTSLPWAVEITQNSYVLVGATPGKAEKWFKKNIKEIE